MSARKADPLALKNHAGEPERPAVARRNTLLYAAAALLALIGLGDAIYLTVEHFVGNFGQCTTGGCEQVRTSVYATIKGVPLAGVGALAYFTAFSLATLAAFGNRRAETLLFYLVILMLAVSAWLFYLQAAVIHAFCLFCLLSGAVTLLLAAVVCAARFYFGRRRALG